MEKHSVTEQILFAVKQQDLPNKVSFQSLDAMEKHSVTEQILFAVKQQCLPN
jgi:hypothetical protein